MTILIRTATFFLLLLVVSSNLVIAAPCVPDPTALCLSDGRFKVEVQWKDFAGNTGVGQAVPITTDTGYFWFFNSTNVELIVKVLNGRVINGHFWVFFGALSNVEYRLTVTDTNTGAIKTYLNPSGQFASVGDTEAFPASSGQPVPMHSFVEIEGSEAPPSSLGGIQRWIEAGSIAAAADAPCPGSDTELVVSNCRFRISVSWKDFQDGTGEGHAVALTSDTGYFWFFSPNNVEIVIKVLDARVINGHHWVFFGALSNVGYTISVTDTVTGRERTYTNPVGQFASVGDTEAFHPPSFELIDLAESTGAINSETALLYRVYSLFGDSRLPGKYRGDDSGIPDSLYMSEVVQQFPTLSPVTREAVQPFLIPPVYAGSWANSNSSSVRTLLINPSCDSTDPKYKYVDSANNFVRVWYRADLADEESKGKVLAAAIDEKIWEKFANLMRNHLPLSDIGESCNGGNGRLDIYVVLMAGGFNGITIPYAPCKPTPVFVLVSTFAPDRFDTVTHEIFHAFQNSFRRAQCVGSKDYQWWSEASATWAQDFVAKDSQREQDYAKYFLDVPEHPLEQFGGIHPYGAYLLPFFVHRKTGSADFVRMAWENCATEPAVEAVDKAIGGFEKVWPEFAKQNWNQPPVDDYKKWDALAIGARKSKTKIRTGDGVSIWPIEYELPPLSASYHHILFSDDDSSVVFWNGVTHKLSLQSDEFGSGYVPEAVSGDAKKGARIWALIKLSGQSDWQTADWTDRPYVKFCRDTLAERIDELVLIVSNSEFKDRERKLKPPDLSPIVWASNMGCGKWQGTATATENREDLRSTVTISANVTWTLDALQNEEPSNNLYKAEGTVNWNVSGNCTGSGTLQIDPQFSQLITQNFAPKEHLFHRTYYGFGFVTPGVEVTVSCAQASGPPRSEQIDLPSWFQAPLFPVPGVPAGRFVRVKPNGKIIDDSDNPSETESFKWHFEAKREP